MRWISFACLFPLPAAAWDFTPGPPCVLSHEAPAVEIVVTHDPGPPVWSIALTRRDGVWPAAPSFAIAFEGPGGFSIGTDRHELSGDGATLTVTDTGFGNVLAGLSGHATALASTGGTSVALPLEGAAPFVPLLEDCRPATS